MFDQPRVLVCDDDDLIRFSMAMSLRDAGYEVSEARDGAEALDLVAKQAPRCVILDLVMPGIDGLTTLRTLREQGNDVPVIVVTATGSIDSAIAATRLGAADFLQKPFDLRELLLAVERALREDRLRSEVSLLRDRERSGYGEFVGASRALDPLFHDLRKLEEVVAPTVLVLGESGTGKEVVARSLHARGPRKEAMFIEVDCTALPEALIESELFGHEKGAFTDAKATKRGLMEIASGGVLFLDEIGELPLIVQAKLLRVLENRTFKRVGGLANIKLDASIIAATNRDLKKEVAAGRFREDLYYRLHVVTLKLPPLRERKDDIPLLTSHFLARLNRDFGRSIGGLERDALERMMAYDWPGNVRELKNMLERIAILGAPERIELDDLPIELLSSPRGASADANPDASLVSPSGQARECSRGGLAASQESMSQGATFVLPEAGVDLERVEREFVVQALERTAGNQTAAARLLGISRFQLRNRIEKFGIPHR